MYSARILLGETRLHITRHQNELTVYAAISEATTDQGIQVLKASVPTVKLYILIFIQQTPCGEHFTFHCILFIRGHTFKPLPLRKKRKNSLILYFTIIYRPFSIFKELSNRLVFIWLYVLTRNSEFSSLMPNDFS